MKTILGCFLASCFLFGCTSGTGQEDEADDSDGERVGSAESAVRVPNAVSPNAVSPNAVSPNAVSPNAVSPNALAVESISSSVMSALRDPGEAGDLSRMHVKYLVSCSFYATQTFSFTWTDSQEVVRNEVYRGALGLAPAWTTRGLTEPEQRWVSACMGARTNFYGTSVLISMRGGHTALGTDLAERDAYSMQEGAFVGNIFSPIPFLKACYNADNVSHSRSKLRDCATGHWNGTNDVDCGVIDVTGPCSSLCTVDPGTASYGFASCDGFSEVITTYLPL